MIQRGDGSGFPLEALAELLSADLDSDRAVQAGVAGFVYFAHAAGANRRDDLVGAELRARYHDLQPCLSSTL